MSSVLTPVQPIVAQCETLNEARVRVDQADRQIALLLAERAHYERQIAAFMAHPRATSSSIEHDQGNRRLNGAGSPQSAS